MMRAVQEQNGKIHKYSNLNIKECYFHDSRSKCKWIIEFAASFYTEINLLMNVRM